MIVIHSIINKTGKKLKILSRLNVAVRIDAIVVELRRQNLIHIENMRATKLILLDNLYEYVSTTMFS